MKSLIDDFSVDELIDIANKSNSYVEMLEHMGMDGRGRNAETMKSRYLKHGLGNLLLQVQSRRIEILKKNTPGNKIPDEEFFVDGARRSKVSSRIIKEGLLGHNCQKCGCGEVWMGEPIRLQVDHINGINTDNRLDNLRLLCPNCHSQTNTYAGRGRLTPRPKCAQCGKIVTKKSSGLCVQCSNAILNADAKLSGSRRRVKDRPSKEEIQRMVDEQGYSSVGRQFGISGNAVKKWLNE